jgi:Type VI secretion system, TssO
MKPINKKERTKAFNKVIGLFVLCFALAVLVGFTTMNVNRLSDSKSVNELAKLKTSLKFEEETFAPNIDQATKIIVKIPKAKESAENPDLLNAQVADLMSATKSKVTPDESWQSLMYQNIINIYSDLQLAYKDKAKMQERLDDCANNTTGSDKELQRCLNEKRDIQNELTMLKLAGSSGGGGGGGGNTAELEKNLKTCNDQVRQLRLENKSLLTELKKLKTQ